MTDRTFLVTAGNLASVSYMAVRIMSIAEQQSLQNSLATFVGRDPLRDQALDERILEQSVRGGRIGDQVHRQHLVDRLDHDVPALELRGPAGVVGKADVLRGVLGVPNQLLGQDVFGVEVQRAVEPVFAEPHVLQAADPVPIAAPRARLDVIHIDRPALVERNGPPNDRRRVLAALGRYGAQELDAGDGALFPVDLQRDPPVVGVLLENTAEGVGSFVFFAFFVVG